MAKSPDAFRTIGEVSDALDTPAHVLRFWESKFAQVKPVKRAGGRRYYRPDDLALLGGIRVLLHDQGLTIKGAQKILREQGVAHVAGLGRDALRDDADTDLGEGDVIDHVEVARVVPLHPSPTGSAQVSVLTLAARATPATLRHNARTLGPLVARLDGLLDRMTQQQ